MAIPLHTDRARMVQFCRSCPTKKPNMIPKEQAILASDGLSARPTGTWVRDKNFYVERYLAIFSKGVGRKWKGNLAYVDLFAGPGRNIVRDTGEEVEGSPLLALKYPFAKYVFVDLPDVLNTLEVRIGAHPKKAAISMISGDCNTVIEQILGAVPANCLTLAFIDPPGIQIKFATLRRLVHGRKVDLLMTIQFGMGIRLNIRQYSRADRDSLSDFIGGGDWKEDYREGGAISQVGRRILDRYLGQLRTLSYRTVRDREIYVHSDQRNLLLYLILLASRHPLGEEFWRKVTDVSASGQRLLDLRPSE